LLIVPWSHWLFPSDKLSFAQLAHVYSCPTVISLLSANLANWGNPLHDSVDQMAFATFWMVIENRFIPIHPVYPHLLCIYIYVNRVHIMTDCVMYLQILIKE
jgi:hypothetical protein